MSTLVIELWPYKDDCIVCGKRHIVKQGLAMYEGEIVADDYEGEWGGFNACRDCYERNRGHVGVPIPPPDRIVKNCEPPSGRR